MPEPQFNLDLPQSPLEVYPPFNTNDRSIGMKEVVIALSSARTGDSVEVSRQKLDALGEDFLSTISKNNVFANIENDFQESVGQAVEILDVELAVAANIERLVQEDDINNDPASEATDLLSFSAGELYDAGTKLGLSRMVGTMKRLDQKMEETGASVLSILGDILDLIVSAPLDGLTLAGFDRIDKVEFLRNQMSNKGITNEEYYQLLDDTIEELEDAGWFTENNYLYLGAGVSNIAEGNLGFSRTLENVGTALDLGFGISSVVKLGTKTIPRLAGRFRNTTKISGVVGNPEAAGVTLRDAASKPGTLVAEAAGVAEETTPSVARIVAGADTGMVAPGARIAADVEVDNRILNIFRDAGFSRSLDPALITAWIPTGLRRLSETLSAGLQNRVRNLEILPNKQDNLFGVITLGKADGLPFKDVNAANRVASQNGGTVRKTIIGGEERWEVLVTKNLSTKDLVQSLEVGEIGAYGLSGIMLPFARAFGGNFLALPDRLSSLALRGEGVLGQTLAKISPILEEKLAALGAGELDRVDRIFFAMRDGERFAQQRKALSLAEFRSEWARNPGPPPSKAAEEFYFTMQEVNNSLYFLKADKIFKQVVNEGSEVLQFSTVRRGGEVDDVSIIVNGIRHDEIPEGEKILHLTTGERKAISGLGRNERVFKIADGGYEIGGETAVYVTIENPSLRRVFHSDVLGYNAGGPRTYKNIRFFVKQATEVIFLNGRKAVGKARTFLGVSTREEAVFAAGEMNATLKGLRDLSPGLEGMATRANAVDAIRALRTNPLAEQIIRTHAAWNNSIDSVDTFVDFMLRHKLDPRKNLTIAGKDEAMEEIDEFGNAIFGARGGETYGDNFEEVFNLPRTRGPRGDQPVLGLGGDFAETLSPIDSIQNDLLRVSHAKAFEAFGFQAVNGWLEGAKGLIKNRNALKELTPLEQMKTADFGKNPSRQALAYIDARDATLRTLGNRTEYDLKWKAMINRVGDYVYDKGLKKSADVLWNNTVAQSPLQFLRGIVFDARLGMLDPAQLVVQASQAVNIIAIAGPVKGIRAAATHLPLRMAMKKARSGEWSANDATLMEIGRRTSAWTGLEAEEFTRLAKWTRLSGRLNIGDEVAEISGITDTLARGYFRKARDISRVFFNEGEKVPRSAAITVAWREFAEQFPKLDPFAEFGTKWITSRQNALTAGMTRANAAAWQRGPLSVPLQFMTYSGRMMESLFTNRLLTVKERARLATAQVAFWGSAGLGVGSLVDAYILESGWQINETEYTLLRYGALDALLNASLGTQAVFGGRLAMAEGFSDLIENLLDSNFVEALGGPAGGLTRDVSFALWQGGSDIVRGNVDMVQADLKKVVRQFTGPNKLYNAWFMFTMGEYLSRNDTVVVRDLSTTDALLHTFGGQIRDANLAYTRLEVMSNEDERLKEHGKRLSEMAVEARKLIEAGDLEGGASLMGQIAAGRAMLEPHQMRKTNRQLYPQLDSLFQSVLNKGTADRLYGRLVAERGE